jgi:Rieske 2Fe-2S family protein
MLDLRRLLAARRPGYMLEAPFYADQAVFAADLAQIFETHWVFVGVEPEIPEPGDVMTVQVGANSILICRDDDGAIQAMHNICRHRGARLISEDKACVGRLVCPYHSWTYGLDGKLLHAEHMGADFDFAAHGLKPVHVRSLGGLIFVCLAAAPPDDFQFMADTVLPYIAPHDLTNCKIAYQSDLIEEGNWKLTIENNRECYHCAPNHPELTASIFEFGFGFDVPEQDTSRVALRDRYDEMVCTLTNEWDATGFPAREIQHLEDRITAFRIGRMPMDGAGESQTLDTKVACRKLLGDITEKRLGDLSFHTAPNSWHHFMSDHIVTFCALPVAPGRTLVRTTWLVHKDAIEGVDYDVENLVLVWRETNAQDAKLVALAQKGAESNGYSQGPYSPQTEAQVESFIAWYVARMQA